MHLCTRSSFLNAAIVAAALLATVPAHALPAFARQTGQNCIACHVSFPELTPYGRYFKLSGYTLGERQTLPFAMMAEVGYTKTRDNQVDDGSGTGTTTPLSEDDGKVKFSDAGLFLAGKANDNIGAFVQWTYDGIEHHSSIDNTDIRIVGRYEAPGSKEPDLIYGLTLHNNPTVQDVWNSTPAFSFPFTGSPVANEPSTPGALVDGTLAQQTTGIGGYLYWKKMLYGELTLYRDSTGPFSWMRAPDLADSTRLKGYNPYWRIAYNHEWDANSIEVGAFGMTGKVYLDPTDTGSPTNKYTDWAIDGQYQYITDPQVFTAQATYIHEKQSLDASFNAGNSTNASDTLKTFRAKGTYYYQRKYGATLAYAQTTGSADPLLYASGTPGTGFAANGLPDSTSWTLELDYLPIQNVRLMAQYIWYTKFNGASTNYDGFGRDASANNTLFLNMWVAF
ncbi:MAG: cytochrome C [Gemmatimonadota bacterium]